MDGAQQRTTIFLTKHVKCIQHSPEPSLPDQVMNVRPVAEKKLIFGNWKSIIYKTDAEILYYHQTGTQKKQRLHYSFFSVYQQTLDSRYWILNHSIFSSKTTTKLFWTTMDTLLWNIEHHSEQRSHPWTERWPYNNRVFHERDKHHTDSPCHPRIQSLPWDDVHHTDHHQQPSPSMDILLSLVSG